VNPASSEAFWAILDELVSGKEIVIDRPRNSVHPRYGDLVYPLDYGYLAGTMASDGGGIDIWVGTAEHPVVVGMICTFDLLKYEMEIKILYGCDEAEIEAVERFFEQTLMGHLLVRRFKA
jgi:inorganic pyrophosphatase